MLLFWVGVVFSFHGTCLVLIWVGVGSGGFLGTSIVLLWVGGFRGTNLGGGWFSWYLLCTFWVGGGGFLGRLVLIYWVVVVWGVVFMVPKMPVS